MGQVTDNQCVIKDMGQVTDNQCVIKDMGQGTDNQCVIKDMGQVTDNQCLIKTAEAGLNVIRSFRQTRYKVSLKLTNILILGAMNTIFHAYNNCLDNMFSSSKLRHVNELEDTNRCW